MLKYLFQQTVNRQLLVPPLKYFSYLCFFLLLVLLVERSLSMSHPWVFWELFSMIFNKEVAIIEMFRSAVVGAADAHVGTIPPVVVGVMALQSPSRWNLGAVSHLNDLVSATVVRTTFTKDGTTFVLEGPRDLSWVSSGIENDISGGKSSQTKH